MNDMLDCITIKLTRGVDKLPSVNSKVSLTELKQALSVVKVSKSKLAYNDHADKNREVLIDLLESNRSIYVPVKLLIPKYKERDYHLMLGYRQMSSNKYISLMVDLLALKAIKNLSLPDRFIHDCISIDIWDNGLLYIECKYGHNSILLKCDLPSFLDGKQMKIEDIDGYQVNTFRMSEMEILKFITYVQGLVLSTASYFDRKNIAIGHISVLRFGSLKKKTNSSSLLCLAPKFEGIGDQYLYNTRLIRNGEVHVTYMVDTL